MITGLLVTLRIGLVGITGTDMTLGTILLSSKNHLYENFKNNLTSKCHFIYIPDNYTEPVSEPVTQMALKLINNNLISVQQKR